MKLMFCFPIKRFSVCSTTNNTDCPDNTLNFTGDKYHRNSISNIQNARLDGHTGRILAALICNTDVSISFLIENNRKTRQLLGFNKNVKNSVNITTKNLNFKELKKIQNNNHIF